MSAKPKGSIYLYNCRYGCVSSTLQLPLVFFPVLLFYTFTILSYTPSSSFSVFILTYFFSPLSLPLSPLLLPPLSFSPLSLSLLPSLSPSPYYSVSPCTDEDKIKQFKWVFKVKPDDPRERTFYVTTAARHEMEASYMYIHVQCYVYIYKQTCFHFKLASSCIMA